MEINREELAWAGGLFEGEGCLSCSYNAHYASVIAILGMSDLDSVERFQRAIGFGKIRVRPVSVSKPRSKTMYIWQVTNFQHFQAMVAALWPWFGARRKERAIEILRRACSNRIYKHAKRNG